MSTKYNEDNIQTLDAIEHIRLRTGMYIGRKGTGAQYEDGIYILMKEVIDNAIDEFVMGFGKRCVIKINYATGQVAIRDYGRGIPLGKVVECVSQMNTGGKYNDDVFQFSVGMNGVGTKAVNALSEAFTVRATRDNRYVEANFQRGKLIDKTEGETRERNGTFVAFKPDPEIFPNYTFREEHVKRRIKMYAYLNANLSLDLNGESFISENGLRDLIDAEAGGEGLYDPICYRSPKLEIAFTHTNHYGDDYYSFVNGQYTNDGGTHASAFKEGVLKAINDFAKKHYDGDDVRDGIIGAVAIRLKEPVFESQTKNKLGNPEIRSGLVQDIRSEIEAELHRNPEQAQLLLNKIEETTKIRAELSNVKKLVRERAKAVTVRVPQLKDCKFHLNRAKEIGDNTMIFLTEGNSAGGTITNCRDANTQAIFTLRGKSLNVCDEKRDAIYKNKEFYNLMKALGIEQNPDSLRYQKVILATDADVDGLHIRNLLITFFLRFFDHVIKDGNLFILETPLFRIRNKQKTFYCYTEEDRRTALEACGKSAEITRFKGLGEINADEFRDFIGKDMRLTPVDIHNDSYVQETLKFFMGANSSERRQYILDNLVVDNTDT